MPDPQAAPLHVSPQQQDILEHIVRRTTSAQRLVKRSRIIVLAITGMPNTQIAQQVQVDHETVRRWRDRWRAAEARLQAIEATGKPKLLSQAIEALLTDELVIDLNVRHHFHALEYFMIKVHFSVEKM